MTKTSRLKSSHEFRINQINDDIFTLNAGSIITVELFHKPQGATFLTYPCVPVMSTKYVIPSPFPGQGETWHVGPDVYTFIGIHEDKYGVVYEVFSSMGLRFFRYIFALQIKILSEFGVL